MRRYFFHLRDGHGYDDDVGIELGDLSQVRSKATRIFGEMLAADDGGFWAERDWQMDVTDESGLILFRLTLVAHDAPTVSSSIR